MICVCRGVTTQGVVVLQHWGVLGVCTYVHTYVLGTRAVNTYVCMCMQQNGQVVFGPQGGLAVAELFCDG